MISYQLILRLGCGRNAWKQKNIVQEAGGMVKVYNSVKFFDEKEILFDSEAFFDGAVSARNFDEDNLNVMKKIDKAVLLDKDTGTIKIPFGVCRLEDLSTGCKTILSLIEIIKNKKYANIKAINATECGYNAIEEIFKIIENSNSDIGVVIEHDNDLYKCSERDYLINDKKVKKRL